MIRLILLPILLLQTNILLAESSKIAANKCDVSLTTKKDTTPVDYKSHEYVIIPSGRDRDLDLIPTYNRFVREMSEEGGVLDQLGIPRTKQIVEFVSGVDSKALTATPAAQPVAHYYDGASVLNAIGQSSGGYALEVVFPGPRYQHGYYRDDNPVEWQISILMHVIGHNHFAVTSHFPHYRAAQPTEEASKLDQALKDAYAVAPKEDVENFYLYMQTLSGMMDMYSAHYQDPVDFLIDKEEVEEPAFGDTEGMQKRKAIRDRGLAFETENVLAAFVARIQQSDAAPWKKKLAAPFPYTGVYRPALVHTQVMNEGWASIMQEIIMDHMGEEWNRVDHWFAAEGVVAGTPHIQFQDPYWLGVRAWRRLKERFEERPEIMALETDLEKDRAFVKYATEDIISQMDDFQFLNLALDDFWIQGMGLAIYRDATWEEAQKLPPPPPEWKDPQPKMIVTKDPERIRKLILHNSVGSKMWYTPRVKLKSFNRAESGEVELVIEDSFGKNVPLDTNSIGPALYALSNVVGQPVSLEATFKEMIQPKQDEMDDVHDWAYGYPIFFRPAQPEPRLLRGRLTVNAAGVVEFKRLSEVEDDQIIVMPVKETVTKALDQYLVQVHLEDDGKMSQIVAENPRLERLAMHALNQTINGLPTTSLIEHVPAAADAINEYQSKVASRMVKAFELAMNGKGGLVNTQQGLFLKALPSPVRIQFDSQYLNHLVDTAEGGQLDQHMFTNPVGGDSAHGDLIGPTDKAPGTGGWSPGPGDGQGQGKGEGEPGEPREEPGEGPLPGDVGLDPSWVSIPESLYAQFLGEKVKLPNLKPKNGKVRSKKQRMRGQQNRRDGHLMIDQTALNALQKGLGANEALGKDSFDTDLLETLELGFGLMRPRDFVVKKSKPVNKPDSQAVITFARDASGSTTHYTELYKRFVYDMKTLIKDSYQNVVFEYVIFDTKAYVMKSEEEFFKAALGGGTDYRAGVEKVRELHNDKYPENKWDRFAFVVGDLGDYFSPETKASYESLVEESSYSGTLKAGYGVEEFHLEMEKMAEENEFYGYVNLGENPEGYMIEHLRTLLKNTEEE